MNGNKRKNSFIKYGMTVLIGGLIVYTILVFHGYAYTSAPVEKYRILSDAFTIPGVVLMLCAALIRLSNEGIFDGISYALTYTIKMLIPGSGRTKQERYADYIQQKKENGKIRGYQFIFYTGTAFFSAAVFFLFLYYSIQ